MSGSAIRSSAYHHLGWHKLENGHKEVRQNKEQRLYGFQSILYFTHMADQTTGQKMKETAVLATGSAREAQPYGQTSCSKVWHQQQLLSMEQLPKPTEALRMIEQGRRTSLKKQT